MNFLLLVFGTWYPIRGTNLILFHDERENAGIVVKMINMINRSDLAVSEKSEEGKFGEEAAD